MSYANAHGGNDHHIPESISRSSSLTLVSPIMKDGVDEIATVLAEVDGIIEGLDVELSPNTAHVPDIEDLLQEIAELHKEVEDIKIAHDTQTKAMRDEVKKDTKTQIAQLIGDKVESVITETIAAQVKQEMEDWGNKPGTVRFVDALQTMVEKNEVLFVEARIELENSRSRHANSTFDVQDDFNAKLRSIKHRDGRVSELFPIHLRELFSYTAEQLVRLIKEYDLVPLDSHSENLSRFLIFIGINASIPEQFFDFSEEQLPAYDSRDTTWTRDGKGQRVVRRASSASQESARQGNSSSWYSLWPSG